MKNIYVLCLSILFFSACVPLKQFEELEQENQLLQNESSVATEESNRLKVKNKELESDLQRYKKKVEFLAQDTARLGRQIQRLQHRYEDLNRNYADVLSSLKSNPASDQNNRELLKFLQELQDDLQKREDALLAAEQALNDKKRKLEQTMAELSGAELKLGEQSERLIELEEMLRKKDEAMMALKKTISDALTGFSGDELQVHMKDGKVYVSLEEKLLFQSGSYDVNQLGVDALKKIANVLEQNTDIDILVEGHTDNVPYNGKGMLKDNWDLSVKRATSVVRIMLDNSSISANRITAAGRGEHSPIRTGNDAASLQKNRRTEIILTPKWTEVMEILNLGN